MAVSDTYKKLCVQCAEATRGGDKDAIAKAKAAKGAYVAKFRNDKGNKELKKIIADVHGGE